MSPILQKTVAAVLAVGAGTLSLNVAFAVFFLAAQASFAQFPLQSLAIVGVFFSVLATAPWLLRETPNQISERWSLSLLFSGGIGMIMGVMVCFFNNRWDDLWFASLFMAGLGLTCGLGTSAVAHVIRLWDKPANSSD